MESISIKSKEISFSMASENLQGNQELHRAEMQESLELKENIPYAEKRVFCNAFTGCGKKRSVNEENSVDSKSLPKDKRIAFSPSIFKKLLKLLFKVKDKIALLYGARERNENFDDLLSYLSDFTEEIQAQEKINSNL
ncbi:hypothetical protein NPIL_341201 [Nephila pilipes]|uniref:Cardioactive peptide n=1 Tax=Nephila pilipes TaxID=299642 RepID=A0A8X6QEV8_NEPPI|nr:hypothetical protein NPIL_341201 [Nephila pilipes]